MKAESMGIFMLALAVGVFVVLGTSNSVLGIAAFISLLCMDLIVHNK